MDLPAVPVDPPHTVSPSDIDLPPTSQLDLTAWLLRHLP
jgi:hypothetical protein